MCAKEGRLTRRHHAIQVKRIHEYKRQFLNVLGIIHRYHTIKSSDDAARAKACCGCLVLVVNCDCKVGSFFLLRATTALAPLRKPRPSVIMQGLIDSK